jgi:hypothetical protein
MTPGGRKLMVVFLRDVNELVGELTLEVARHFALPRFRRHAMTPV